MIYSEFRYVLKDYFLTLTKKEFWFEWIIPLLIGSTCFFALFFKEPIEIPDFNSAFITLLGILVGFSIAMLTVMTTSSNKNVEFIKKMKSGYIIDNIDVSLYRLFLINIGYSIIIEIFLLIFNIVIPIVLSNHNLYTFSISIFLITHILFVNIRTVTNFYFIESSNLK